MAKAKAIKPRRRAGIAAPHKKPGAKKRTSVSPRVRKALKNIFTAPAAKPKKISPIDLMHGVIFALNEFGVFFNLVKATEDRFTFSWQSIPDERHHATIRLQAGPEWFYCRILFTPLSALLDTDLIMLEMERELQG